MVSANKIACVFFVVICLSLHASAQYCMQQNCKECPAEAEKAKGESVKCDMRSQVSIAWLGEPHYPNLNLTGINSTTEFSCITMVAAKANTDENGDSTDVIKGCSVKSLAHSTCEALIKVQERRSKKATCQICDGNECNGSMATSGSIVILFASVILAKLINH